MTKNESSSCGSVVVTKILTAMSFFSGLEEYLWGWFFLFLSTSERLTHEVFTDIGHVTIHFFLTAITMTYTLLINSTYDIFSQYSYVHTRHIMYVLSLWPNLTIFMASWPFPLPPFPPRLSCSLQYHSFNQSFTTLCSAFTLCCYFLNSSTFLTTISQL